VRASVDPERRGVAPNAAVDTLIAVRFPGGHPVAAATGSPVAGETFGADPQHARVAPETRPAPAGSALPTFWISVAAAVAFLGFGLWTLRGDALSRDEEERADRSGRSAVLAASLAFLLAELGDKTMLATITLATQYPGWGGVVGVWAGSTVGMVVADGLAITAGRLLGRSLPDRAVRVGAAVLFLAFGIWLAVEAFLHR
jgi:putative Ca2+/H+ antiporter (TMEM165/GDT1 family)